MKKLVLLAFLLARSGYIFAQCPGTNCYVAPAPTGTGNAYTFAAPGLLEELMDCDNGLVPVAGDTIHLRGGTYPAGVSGNDSKYVLRGFCSGSAAAPITIRRYLDEEAAIDCAYALDEITGDGRNICLGIAGNAGTGKVNTNGTAVAWVSGNKFITGSTWVGRRITIDDPARNPATTPPTYYTISSVTNSTNLVLTTPVPGGAHSSWNIGDIMLREHVTFRGLKTTNSTTKSRFSSVGHVQVTNGDDDIVWIDGSDDWDADIAGTAIVNTAGTTVDWVSGKKFCRQDGCAGGLWPNKWILINDVQYVVDLVQEVPTGCTLNNCTRLTLRSSAGTQTGVTARLPNTEFSDADGGIFYLNTAGAQDVAGPYVQHQVFYCTDATHCKLRAPVTALATGTYEAKFPWTNGGIGRDNPEITNVNGSNYGTRFINNYFFDRSGGTIFGSDLSKGGVLWYGNHERYSGVVGLTRGAGHGNYMQNPIRYNEAGRTRWGGNLIYRPFFLGGQIYSETGAGINSYITMDDNIYVVNGHKGWPIATWVKNGGDAAGGGQYIGSVTASYTTGCPEDYPWPERGAVGGSSKTAKNNILNRNFFYNPNNAPFNLGGGKGSCGSQITNNWFITDSQPAILRKDNSGSAVPVLGCPARAICGTYSPTTITSNVWMSDITATQTNLGGPIPPLNQTNYPPGPTGNVYYTSVAAAATAIGADVKFYEPNEYEPGKGFAGVWNTDGSATVTVDLCSFGGFVNQDYDLFNGQCADPWDCPVITTVPPGGGTGRITACPFNVTVSATMTAADIPRPAGRDRDGVTVMPRPPDIGPEFVGLSLERDFSAAAPTPPPTATLTPSNTSTPTPSYTRTSSPTLTPTRTFTASPTLTPTRTFTSGGPTVTPTFTASNTASPSPTYTITNTPTITPTPPGGVQVGISIDVGNCTIIPPMVLTDTGVFPGHYVSSDDSLDGMIECPFSIPTTALYYLYAKTGEATSLNDSFFYSIDDEDPTSACNTSEDNTCTNIFDTGSSKDPNDGCAISRNWGTISWKNWNDRSGSDGICVGEGSRMSITLQAGNHTIRVRQRDLDTRLYYMTFSTDPNLEPGDPLPTPTPGVRGHKHKCPGYRLYHNHEYGAAHKHGLCTWGY